jgi:hypothetical protein
MRLVNTLEESTCYDIAVAVVLAVGVAAKQFA